MAERGDRADGNTVPLGKQDEHSKVNAAGKKKKKTPELVWNCAFQCLPCTLLQS